MRRAFSTDQALRNVLALLALLSLGVVWPPPFDAIQPGGPLRYVVTADSIAGAGIGRRDARPARRVSSTQ